MNGWGMDKKIIIYGQPKWGQKLWVKYTYYHTVNECKNYIKTALQTSIYLYHMKSSEISSFLQVIASYSQRLREIYTSYGFSYDQILEKFKNLICSDEHIEILASQSDQKERKSREEKDEKQSKNLQQIMVVQMSIHKSNLWRYFSKVVRNFEIQIAQLEEYEKQSQSIFVPIKQIQPPKIQRIESIQILQENVTRQMLAQERDQKEDLSPTETEMIAIQHEIKLENSLQALIYKTKLLRSILERQMVSASVKQLKGQPHCHINTLNNFLVE